MPSKNFALNKHISKKCKNKAQNQRKQSKSNRYARKKNNCIQKRFWHSEARVTYQQLQLHSKNSVFEPNCINTSFTYVHNHHNLCKDQIKHQVVKARRKRLRGIRKRYKHRSKFWKSGSCSADTSTDFYHIYHNYDHTENDDSMNHIDINDESEKFESFVAPLNHTIEMKFKLFVTNANMYGKDCDMIVVRNIECKLYDVRTEIHAISENENETDLDFITAGVDRLSDNVGIDDKIDVYDIDESKLSNNDLIEYKIVEKRELLCDAFVHPRIDACGTRGETYDNCIPVIDNYKPTMDVCKKYFVNSLGLRETVAHDWKYKSKHPFCVKYSQFIENLHIISYRVWTYFVNRYFDCECDNNSKMKNNYNFNLYPIFKQANFQSFKSHFIYNDQCQQMSVFEALDFAYYNQKSLKIDSFIPFDVFRVIKKFVGTKQNFNKYEYFVIDGKLNDEENILQLRHCSKSLSIDGDDHDTCENIDDIDADREDDTDTGDYADDLPSICVKKKICELNLSANMHNQFVQRICSSAKYYNKRFSHGGNIGCEKTIHPKSKLVIVDWQHLSWYPEEKEKTPQLEIIFDDPDWEVELSAIRNMFYDSDDSEEVESRWW